MNTYRLNISAMAIRHDPGWYKKLASGKVDHTRNQVNNIGYIYMDKAGRPACNSYYIYTCSQLQPAPVVRQKEGFAEIPAKIGTHAVFLHGGSLKGNIALKD